MPFPSTEGPSGEHGSALPRILFVQMRPQNDCPRSNIISCPSGGLEVDFVDLDASLLAEQVQQQANSPSPRHRPVERGLQARQQPIPNSDAGTTGKPGSRTDETNVSYPVLNSDYHVVRHGNRGFTSPQDRSHAWIPADSVPGAGVHAPRDHLDEQVPGEEGLEPSLTISTKGRKLGIALRARCRRTRASPCGLTWTAYQAALIVSCEPISWSLFVINSMRTPGTPASVRQSSCVASTSSDPVVMAPPRCRLTPPRSGLPAIASPSKTRRMKYSSLLPFMFRAKYRPSMTYCSP